jgi:hypothetical protein
VEVAAQLRVKAGTGGARCGDCERGPDELLGKAGPRTLVLDEAKTGSRHGTAMA